MKKASLLLLFAALALLSLWWWQRGDELTPVPAEQPSASPAVTNVPAAPAVAPASDAANSPGRTAADASAASSEVAAADGRFYDVLVVDGASQQPIAGAEVWVVDEAVRARYRTLPADEYRALSREPDALAERFGRTARSDANGRLRLFASKKGVSLHGRHGGRYGRLGIVATREDPPDGHRLVLVADETLRVLVRDAEGRPAVDVPVDLRRRLADGSERDVVRGDERDTDASGLVAFPHVQRVRHGDDPGYEQEPAAALVVAVAIHGLPPVRAVLDASVPAPAEPVVLQLPACGALSVRFVIRGQSLPGVESVRMHAGPDGVLEAMNQAWTQAVDTDGWAHFPFVPVQPQLFVHAAAEWRLPDFAVAGPGAPGVVARHEIELADRAIVLRGRVLGADDRPLARVVAQLHYGLTTAAGSGPLRLDDEGRFLCVFAASRPGDAEPPASLELNKFSLQLEVEGTQSRVKAEPRAVQIGINELGDLRVEAEPIACSGRLVGATLAAPVRVLLRVEVGRNTASGVQWQPDSACRGRVAADGTFVVNGTPKGDRLRLLVRNAQWLPVAPVEFLLGQRDLTITVADGETLAIECMLPTGDELGDLSLMLRGGPADATVPAEALSPTSRRLDPRLAKLERRSEETVRATWAGLQPGTYTLCVELPGHGAPLHERPGVVLPPPDGAQQAPLDLREWLRWVRLDARRGDSSPLTDQKWLLFPQPQPLAADSVWGGMVAFGNRDQVLLGRGVSELLVVGEGFAPQRVAVTGDTVTVVVRPWSSLELALAPGTELPAGTKVQVMLASPIGVPRNVRFQAGGSAGNLDRRLQPDDRQLQAAVVDGRATLPIGDGPHRLTTSLQLGNFSLPLTRTTPSEVVAGGLVVVTLDAAEVAAVAERLRSVVGAEPPASEPK